MSENDDFRQLFHEAASDIRPQGSLDDILDRTKKVDPMTRRWFLPVIAAAAVIGLAIGGAVYLSGDDSPASSTPPPAGSPSANPTTGTSGVEGAVPVYFIGEAAQGPRLYREFQHLSVDQSADGLMRASVATAVTGSPDDPDYRNPWPQGTTVSAQGGSDRLRVDIRGDLHDRPAGMSQAEADLAVQSLVYSAQAGWGKGPVPVQITLNGNPSDTVLGVPTSEPLASDSDVLAPVQISSPSNGTKVPAGDLKVTGVASAFEANVVWELLVGGDAVVKNGHATAAECCKLSPYEFTIEGLEPGTYTLVVHDEDMSGEGRPTNQDTKEIVVE